MFSMSLVRHLRGVNMFHASCVGGSKGDGELVVEGFDRGNVDVSLDLCCNPS